MRADHTETCCAGAREEEEGIDTQGRDTRTRILKCCYENGSVLLCEVERLEGGECSVELARAKDIAR